MSGFLDWLPGVLTAARLDVHVMPGAERRSTWGTGGMPIAPPGVIWHHTATGPRWLDGHVAVLLRDGHRTLSGPLSQTGVERDGTWVVVALGRCNHDGYGRWGNNSIGVEVYNDGLGEPYPSPQLDSCQRGIAAILNHLGHGSGRCIGHKESASHKIDPLLNMNAMRARIAHHQAAAQPPTTEDDDMLAAACAAIEAAYEEAGYPPGRQRGQAIAKWIDEAKRKAAAGGDPWDAVRSCRDQLPGVPVEPTWPT